MGVLDPECSAWEVTAAEQLFSKLGLSVADAINLLLGQVCIQKGIPLNRKDKKGHRFGAERKVAFARFLCCQTSALRSDPNGATPLSQKQSDDSLSNGSLLSRAPVSQMSINHA